MDIFTRLIKPVVRRVVREELSELLDEPLSPEVKQSIESALKDVREGNVGPALKTQKEVQAYLDGLKQ